MPAKDIGLAVLTSVIWGLTFVASKIGLESFSAPQLTALRFLIACLPVLFLPRPQVPLLSLLLIGLTIFTGQFLLLFFAFTEGLAAGLASVTQQTQVFFTVALAAMFLRERPSWRQIVGIGIALAGLVLIGVTVGGDLTGLALTLALASAFCWAAGNILVKRLGRVPMVPLMAWLSLVPPLPALALSAAVDSNALPSALAVASWSSIAAAVYMGVVATIIAYALWARLLSRYPAAVVAPFALIAPCVGVGASAWVFGEAFSPIRYAGMALILFGLAVIVVPVRRAARAS